MQLITNNTATYRNNTNLQAQHTAEHKVLIVSMPRQQRYPDRVRPSVVNDEKIIGQEKNKKYVTYKYNGIKAQFLQES